MLKLYHKIQNLSRKFAKKHRYLLNFFGFPNNNKISPEIPCGFAVVRTASPPMMKFSTVSNEAFRKLEIMQKMWYNDNNILPRNGAISTDTPKRADARRPLTEGRAATVQKSRKEVMYCRKTTDVSEKN